MGLLIVDHRGTIEPDGANGKLREIRTVCCKHCSAVVKIFEGPKDPPKWMLQHHRTCSRCDGPICMACAETMKKTGLCRPFASVVENALKTGVWDENFVYEYKIRPN